MFFGLQNRVIKLFWYVKLTQKLNLENQLVKLKADCEKTVRKRRLSYSDYQDELISKQDYLFIKEDLDNREKLLVKQIGQLQDKLDKWNTEREPDSFINKLLETKHIDKLDRSIIQEMIETIYVFKEKRIKIIYKFAGEIESLRKSVLQTT